MRQGEHIGARIAAYRRLRGLTQREFAEATNFSESLIGKIERGDRAATVALISAATRVLQVDRSDLTGQPYASRDRHEDQVLAKVAAIRREVAAYRMPAERDPKTATLTDLADRTHTVSRLRHQADLAGLGAELPQTLRQLRQAAHRSHGANHEAVMGMLAEVYYAARQLVHKLGYVDLTSLLGERYEWAAGQAGDPHLLRLADVLRAGELDATGDYPAARAILDTTVNAFDISNPTAKTLTVWGWLHLNLAYVAAHARDHAATWAHFTEAQDAARHLGEDTDHYRLAFGPTNTAIWGTALGVELMDSAAALERAEHVTLTDQTPPERAGHHYMDLARAHLLHGRRDAALRSLYAARSIAPQQVRYHPLARETVVTLARAERRSTSTLRGMAAWMGIED